MDNGPALPRDAARQAFKAEISDAISGIVDRDHFLQRLARRVADVTGDAWVAIYTRAGVGGDLLLRSNTMPNARPLPARVSADPRQITDEVVAYSGANPAGQLIISMPIGPDDDVMGALVLYSSTSEPLGQSEMATLAVIAEEIAPAIAVAEHHHAVKQSAVVDLTTGAYVGWYVNQRFDEEIARAQRTQNPVTVVIASVLGFEDFQREAGFDAGDALLRDLTTEYAGLTRVFDVVGMRGRSEFTILLPDTDLSQAGTVIARIHQRSARAIERLNLAADSPSVTVVTGAASFPADGDEATTILVAAEHRFNQNEILHQRMAERE
ncbi:MAG: diguanylate cyclase [Thermomicrobiales bacterium]